jgi:hypothetical protein
MSGSEHLRVTRSGGGLYVNGSEMRTEVLWLKDLRRSCAEDPFRNVVSLNGTQKGRLAANTFLEYTKDNKNDIKTRIIGKEISLVRLRSGSIELGSGAGLLVLGNESDIKKLFLKDAVVSIVMQEELLAPLEDFVSSHNAKINLQVKKEQPSQERFVPDYSMKP